jgi:hypothetical protein
LAEHEALLELQRPARRDTVCLSLGDQRAGRGLL